MDKQDADEAAGLLQRCLKSLMSVISTTAASGITGANFRMACGYLSANAEMLLIDDAVGPPLTSCFDLARQIGITQAQLAAVRNGTLAENPVLLGAILLRDELVQMCLTYEAYAIAATQFTSRADIDTLLLQINAVYSGVEETVADSMDQASFRALIALHAAVVNFLVTAARPLPRMIRFAFHRSMPTLVMAMRLYSDARRADQLLDENRVVHPAFMRPTGQALSR